MANIGYGLKADERFQVKGRKYKVLEIKNSSKIQDGQTVEFVNVIAESESGAKPVFELEHLMRLNAQYVFEF